MSGSAFAVAIPTRPTRPTIPMSAYGREKIQDLKKMVKGFSQLLQELLQLVKDKTAMTPEKAAEYDTNFNETHKNIFEKIYSIHDVPALLTSNLSELLISMITDKVAIQKALVLKEKNPLKLKIITTATSNLGAIISAFLLAVAQLEAAAAQGAQDYLREAIFKKHIYEPVKALCISSQSQEDFISEKNFTFYMNIINCLDHYLIKDPALSSAHCELAKKVRASWEFSFTSIENYNIYFPEFSEQMSRLWISLGGIPPSAPATRPLVPAVVSASFVHPRALKEMPTASPAAPSKLGRPKTARVLSTLRQETLLRPAQHPGSVPLETTSASESFFFFDATDDTTLNPHPSSPKTNMQGIAEFLEESDKQFDESLESFGESSLM